MAIQEYLNVFDLGTCEYLGRATELSGISNSDAELLFSNLGNTTLTRVTKLFQKLVDLVGISPEHEFECIFKQGLRHNEIDVKILSLNGLSESSDLSIVNPVINLFENDSSCIVRVTAVQTLGSRLVQNKIPPAMESKILEILLRALRSHEMDSELWRSSLEATGAIQGSHMPGLIKKALLNPSKEMIRSVLVAIGRTSDERWIPIVIDFLEHPDFSVRLAAVQSLGDIGDESNTEHLKNLFEDESLVVQLGAVSAAQKLGGSLAVELLKIVIQGPEPEVAEAATGALEAMAWEDELDLSVTPEMAGDNVLTRGMQNNSADDVPYDAGEREGWGHISDDGNSFLASDAVRKDDDDPLTPLMDYEPIPGQSDDD